MPPKFFCAGPQLHPLPVRGAHGLPPKGGRSDKDFLALTRQKILFHGLICSSSSLQAGTMNLFHQGGEIQQPFSVGAARLVKALQPLGRGREHPPQAPPSREGIDKRFWRRKRRQNPSSQERKIRPPSFVAVVCLMWLIFEGRIRKWRGLLAVLLLGSLGLLGRLRS